VGPRVGDGSRRGDVSEVTPELLQFALHVAEESASTIDK
jgi:hypothetical protein